MCYEDSEDETFLAQQMNSALYGYMCLVGNELFLSYNTPARV
jgi:hypothetical protein